MGKDSVGCDAAVAAPMLSAAAMPMAVATRARAMRVIAQVPPIFNAASFYTSRGCVAAGAAGLLGLCVECAYCAPDLATTWGTHSGHIGDGCTAGPWISLNGVRQRF